MWNFRLIFRFVIFLFSEFLHVAFNFVREHRSVFFAGLYLVFKKNKAKILSQRTTDALECKKHTDVL